MLYKKALMLPLLMVLFFPLSSLYAEQLDLIALLKSTDRSRGNLEGLVWSVETQTQEQGEAGQTLKFKLFTKNANSLVRFTSPARMRGQMMLMRDRNMWFIRPGLRKPVAISPRQRLTGAASNGDIASTNYAGDYAAVLLGEARIAGKPCYILELTANNSKVSYDKIKYWISKSDGLGRRADFYTVSGKLFKKATFEYNNTINKGSRTIPFVSKMMISDTTSEIQTTLFYSDVAVQDIANSTFNLNLLIR